MMIPAGPAPTTITSQAADGGAVGEVVGRVEVALEELEDEVELVLRTAPHTAALELPAVRMLCM